MAAPDDRIDDDFEPEEESQEGRGSRKRPRADDDDDDRPRRKRSRRDRDDDDDDRPRRKEKSGNTVWIVVAIVVAVLLLAILICGGLFVMGMGKVRESAARLQSNNNLKQCALAVHTFHDNFNKLPNGFSRGGQQNKDVSMWVHLLPFVEQGALYASFARDDNGFAYKAVVAPYLAPSDQSTTSSSGVVNFAGNVRIFGAKTLQGQPVNVPGSALQIPAGPMLSGLKLSSIEDGTTTTIMLSTRYADCGGQRTWFVVDAQGQSNQGAPPSPGKGGFMGAGSSTTPATRAGALTDMFQLAPSERECRPDAGVFGHSFGPSGMSVALCDSAVRNIAPSMSPRTFSLALCPSDHQKLDADWGFGD